MRSSDIGSEYDAPIQTQVLEPVTVKDEPEITSEAILNEFIVDITKVHYPSKKACPKIDVLNGGFVRLVDYMGDDLSIVRSARVSYDADWREGDEQKDAKLIAYLMKNKHTSPFESVQFTFEVKAPIFVFRQWHRHRTWCLDGDTEISFELPNRLRKGIKTAKKIKIRDLYNRWNAPKPKRQRKDRTLAEWNRERIGNMMLRVYDEKTDKFTTGHIVDVTSGGKKEVFEVTLKNGKKIICSKDHRLLTIDGWLPLKNCSKGTELLCNGTYHTEEGTAAIRAARSGSKSNFWKGGVTSDRANIGRWTREQAPKVHAKYDYTCQKCNTRSGKLHAHHIKAVVDSPELARNFDNLITLCESCHHVVHGRNGDKAMTRGRGITLMAKPSTIKSIKSVGVRETFDISVGGDNHNFVANGIIVHNSYNEISARYTELDEGFYIPEVDQITEQSASNKQMRTNVQHPQAEAFQQAIKEMTEKSFFVYKGMIAAGCPRELARSVLPVAAYSRMFATVNLHNLFHFLRLRLHEHSQYEIRVYAQAMLQLIEPIVPVAVEEFKKTL
jgi:flavin-dependent thymidylate synthase